MLLRGYAYLLANAGLVVVRKGLPGYPKRIYLVKVIDESTRQVSCDKRGVVVAKVLAHKKQELFIIEQACRVSHIVRRSLTL
jgi:hypothetical protein